MVKVYNFAKGQDDNAFFASNVYISKLSKEFIFFTVSFVLCRSKTVTKARALTEHLDRPRHMGCARASTKTDQVF